MADNKFGPQYLTSDGRFTKDRPDWMRPKGCESSSLTTKNYPKSKLSEAAAEKIAKTLHLMLNDK